MEEFDDLVPEPDSKGGVDMSDQGWKKLDDMVWKMGLRIMSLNVSFNKIVELPEQIGDLVLLKELNVANNALEVSIDFGVDLGRVIARLICLETANEDRGPPLPSYLQV